MAITTLTSCSCTLGGTAITAYVSQIEIDDGKESVERTVFGNVARNMGSGIARWTIRITAFQDYGSSALHSIVTPLVNTNVAIIIRMDSTANVSVTNPEWQATGHLARYKRLDAKVGEDPVVVLEFENAGTAISEKTVS
jgi:hypothetical protein